MNGDFKTDITRDTFQPFRHFSRVLMQQGRVQLDADWNEQVDILLHYLRTFIGDVIGPYGGPGDSFLVGKPLVAAKLTKSKRAAAKSAKAANTLQPGQYQLLIQKGHYYVDGILCENDDQDNDYTLSVLPPAEAGTGNTPPIANYFIYLDVWEREVTYLEDARIREVALGGPDTTTRSKVVWLVSAVDPEKTGQDTPRPNDTAGWEKRLRDWKDVDGDHGHLMAQTVEPPETGQEPCVIPATSQYRGVENQLYRVEIHRGSDPNDTNAPAPTFTWSRENGTVVFPIKGAVASGANLTSLTLTLGNFGRDDSRFGLHVDNWVEIVDISHGIEQKPGPLMKVASIDPATRQVTLTSQNGITLPDDSDPERVLLLRRWDYKQGDTSQSTTPTFADDDALQIVPNQALILEDGIEITFVEDAITTTPTVYRTGDYWLIVARTAHGTIENNGVTLPPHGVKHHYAPLAYVELNDGSIVDANSYDLRRIINSIATIPATLNI
ncbi:MAG: DUF6519 domain-containing protein [Ktedonobacteraceae bacterium]